VILALFLVFALVFLWAANKIKNKALKASVLTTFGLLFTLSLSLLFSNDSLSIYKDKFFANFGDTNSQYRVGMDYYQSKGTSKNFYQAFSYFEKAANSNNSDAQDRLGFIYQNGYETDVNYSKAFIYINKSADQNNIYGLGDLGYLYQTGYGVTQNTDKAKYFYNQAIKGGNTNVRELLASLNNPNKQQNTLLTRHQSGDVLPDTAGESQGGNHVMIALLLLSSLISLIIMISNGKKKRKP
jgi:TPR repeat protein